MPPHQTDVLATSNHLRFFRQDLDLVHAAGIDTLRYPVPWHRIETKPGTYNWTWMDRATAALQEYGLDPIADLVHHVSIPAWIKRGFANPEYPQFQTDFAQAFAARYPWITKYTPFNEPFVTVLLAGHEGTWYPYGGGPATFVPMLVNVARAICLTVRALKEVNPQIQIIHIDTCESSRARAGASEGVQAFARFCNDRRFLCDDMLLGKLDESHPLFSYVREHGYTDADMEYFTGSPCHFDVRGLDYYAHSEREYYDGGSDAPTPAPQGFAAVAEEYRHHFTAAMPGAVPAFWLTETNIRGYHTDRLTWLKYMVEQAMQADIPVFCWFPFIDSTGWGESLLRFPHNRIDPVGIYCLDEQRERRWATELSEAYGLLARDTAAVADIPAYEFRDPVDTQLKGFRRQMQHWTWRSAD